MENSILCYKYEIDEKLVLHNETETVFIGLDHLKLPMVDPF